MSGKLKEIKGRIKAVVDIQQTTKAMKMVSAAKLRRAQDAILQMRPYDRKLRDVLSNILNAGGVGDVQTPYAQERESGKALIVLVTSDRGLCGSFNANLFRTTNRLLREDFAAQAASGNVTLLCIGKRGMEAFRRKKLQLVTDHVALLARLNFQASSAVAAYLMNSFISGAYDRVGVVYTRFKNAASQTCVYEQFLPVPKMQPAEASPGVKTKADYIFEPSGIQIMEDLVPRILRTQFFRMLLDSNASEHGARMTAMSKASDNASEFLRDLRLAFNKARQEEITKELSEIVGGANALSDN